MSKKKVMTIVGTRPEIIRLSAVIQACDQYFDHILVHTGQNWDPNLNDIFFDELKLRRPDYVLGVVGKHLGETIGNIISKSYEILLKEKPDALLILGDTNSALSAIAAKRLKVPIFHMEAGNRCFEENVPEEINRRLVDHISDVNLPYTEHSRRYLLSEGIRKDFIFVTGSPMPEVIELYKEKILNSPVLSDLKLEQGKYIVVSAHREENIDHDQNFQNLMHGFNEVAEKYKLPIIYSAHPRSLKRIQDSNIQLHPLINIHKPFGLLDYIKLQQYAFCVLSDSGTLSEESAILNFPAVLIRTSTERPEVLDVGSIVIGGITGSEMIQAIELATQVFSLSTQRSVPLDYEDRNVSIKVVKLIESYTKIINKKIWDK
jgi:UDP-N-acetyl-L-fucosamine synthase